MPKFALCVLAIAAAGLVFAAEATWQQVQELKSGSELRIYKRGGGEPISATFADANEERIVVATKKEELAIAKSDIERIDARPPAVKTRGKFKVNTTATTTEPDYTPHPQAGPAVPGTSYSTGVSRSSTPSEEFATVYRRLMTVPKPSAAQD